MECLPKPADVFERIRGKKAQGENNRDYQKNKKYWNGGRGLAFFKNMLVFGDDDGFSKGNWTGRWSVVLGCVCRPFVHKQASRKRMRGMADFQTNGHWMARPKAGHALLSEGRGVSSKCSGSWGMIMGSS